jgi:hypothetical protein
MLAFRNERTFIAYNNSKMLPCDVFMAWSVVKYNMENNNGAGSGEDNKQGLGSLKKRWQ